MAAATLERAKNIKLLVLDVDGVLTDGGLFFGANGEELKRFHVRDGAGIKRILAAGLSVAVISSRTSPAVERRMGELGVEEVHLDAEDKPAVLERVLGRLGLSLGEVAYVGDDVADVPAMQRVKFAVADAHEEARRVAHYQTTAKGGHGAVREVCDLLLMTLRSG